MRTFFISSLMAPIAICFCSSSVLAADPDGFKTEAELSWIVTAGNSDTNTFSLKDQNKYRFWGRNELRFDARYLSSIASSVETARNWGLGLRYGRDTSERLTFFLAETIDGNVFSGYLQRYNTDVGLKYKLLTAADGGLDWFAEAGYRLVLENPTSGTKPTTHAARLYTEAIKSLSESVSAKFWVEYIPNFSTPADWLLNTELSASVLLSQVFSLKLGYLVKYDAQLNTGVTKNVDTTFTTALVAKF
jgi:putative salt-induced outer membrane protein